MNHVEQAIIDILKATPTDADGTIAIPEVLAGVTDRSVRSALCRLERKGIVVWHRKTPGKVRRPGYFVEPVVSAAWFRAVGAV